MWLMKVVGEDKSCGRRQVLWEKTSLVGQKGLVGVLNLGSYGAGLMGLADVASAFFTFLPFYFFTFK